MEESRFQWICSNVMEPDGKTLFGNAKSFTIKQVDEIKFGFFGICTEECKKLSHPADTGKENKVTKVQFSVDFFFPILNLNCFFFILVSQRFWFLIFSHTLGWIGLNFREFERRLLCWIQSI